MNALPIISTNNLVQQASTVFEVSSSSFEGDPFPKVVVGFSPPCVLLVLRIPKSFAVSLATEMFQYPTRMNPVAPYSTPPFDSTDCLTCFKAW